MILPGVPVVGAERRSQVAELSRRTARQPEDLVRVIREELQVDLTARYAGLTIPHPFGIGAGQLSCTLKQVQDGVAAGLAFMVLKTVIAENPSGGRSMDAWAQGETRMKVEHRTSAAGREGWTVTWKGRGWPGTLAEYLEFLEQSLGAAREKDMPVIPSVKYHLPKVGEPFDTAEYRHTTDAMLGVWGRAGCGGDMILEKDFSPTLAGDDRAGQREAILQWIAEVPCLVGGGVQLGLKLMNALFDDQFQVDMTRAAGKAAFLVVFNRLFDLDRRVAFGGYDLSDRNLRVLDRLGSEALPPLVGTGNICSGRMMLEYALRGCESGQVHTFFQLPVSEYTGTGGGRIARALHTLLLHPTDGLVVWLLHLQEAGRLEPRDGVIHFLDAVRKHD
ncbi:MAG: hypothetical protein EXR93_01265 [Gemmatimonadetes bacterium]|nr:hypothetical protein [Gemmatimonadota bacterium]